MFKTFAVTVIFAGSLCAVSAQTDVPRGRDLDRSNSAKVAKTESNQRRDAVRAAMTESDSLKNSDLDETGKPRHQLSAEQRLQLRQQLRQQRNAAPAIEGRAGES